MGHEIKKTRPVLIVQHNTLNQHNALTIVAPITSQQTERCYITEVRVPEGILPKPSKIIVNQLRCIDRRRLVKRLGTLSPTALHSVNNTLSLVLQLTDD